MLLLSLIVAAGCQRDADDAAPPGGAPGVESPPQVSGEDPQLMMACDSVEEWVRGAITRPVQRIDGEFSGTARGVQRSGCRITATDTLPADLPKRPLELVWQTLAEHGWDVEPSYIADSPEGSMLGMRRESILCVLQHYWATETDDERAAVPDQPAPYDLSVECFREAPGATATDTARSTVRDSARDTAR